MKHNAENPFPIKTKEVGDVFFWQNVGFGIFPLIIFFAFYFEAGFGAQTLVLAGGTYLVLLALFSHWMAKKQVKCLRYWLDGPIVRIDQGVIFIRKKAIPLERVTDLELARGPLLSFCEVWALHIQTAGRGNNDRAEAILYGLQDVEEVRDQLMAACISTPAPPSAISM